VKYVGGRAAFNAVKEKFSLASHHTYHTDCTKIVYTTRQSIVTLL